MKNTSKKSILFSGLLLNIIPAFCSDSVIEESEKLSYKQVLLPIIEKIKVITEIEKNIKELRNEIISSIQVEDIESLLSQPRVYTNMISVIKSKIDNYSDNERTEFKLKLKDLTR